ncbi:HIT zinc finger containing protein [Leishmania donovani]|uniref:HIT_zinc_finger_containing_protein_-_putative n=3 Tax=Leishmania donovani species complex TaxID=38574 RepID=A0A6L0XZB1_LEIIN|nr:conserved hypothetical protein [Leishmania infantum JPCM5]XP_003864049.1 hypothetical protein, conserved [Leishmania donovani]CAC9533165.1 HIT_zinc_finger_containing_protein_-_putative [Leishmania infantum]AYU82205.1 HIT zinc finger containing protein, putative [Leishmania donovani]CAJ1992210.1 HIT zinc finger containing protein [Leishmania donovani]CAM71386.1 conserved hypothetical protein [Leishmania infantum JPCM5]CBZ37367.1 hypothetical protein, conserved [Leishmania donovani]|eukprot:XP_001468302.1 conserved hypothetical protein [Leishmania infantum JPCM5]
MKCVVCDADKAGYRCRACRSAYCSSQCYKKHRMPREEAAAAAAANLNAATSSFAHLCETVVAAQRPQKERDEKRQRTEAEADVFSDVSREKAAAAGAVRRSENDTPPSSTAPAVENALKTATGASEANGPVCAEPQPSARMEYAGDADAVYILQEKHLGALAHDPRVRSALRSPSLQKLIKTVDSSRSRLDALEAAQYNNADFRDFCDAVMRVIAEVEGR